MTGQLLKVTVVVSIKHPTLPSNKMLENAFYEGTEKHRFIYKAEASTFCPCHASITINSWLGHAYILFHEQALTCYKNLRGKKNADKGFPEPSAKVKRAV